MNTKLSTADYSIEISFENGNENPVRVSKIGNESNRWVSLKIIVTIQHNLAKIIKKVVKKYLTRFY